VRRAAKIHPIAFVEVEVSLFEDNALKNGVAKACAELNIPIIAYSPLGRGFLTGQLKSLDDLPQDDMRRHFPRFSPENFPNNLELVHKVEAIAKKKGCTTSQIAIAWVRQLSNQPGMPLFIPIPGATIAERVKENFTIVELSSGDLKEINEVLAGFTTAGERYPKHSMHLVDG
jgi:pyridoxine 4-dehydrogenase